MHLIGLVRSNFNPLFFQASLAAGGIALMAFNFLQFAVPHGEGFIRFTDIFWSSLPGLQLVLYGVLVAVMFPAVIIHVLLTGIFLRGLFTWLSGRQTVIGLINDPYRNFTTFPVIGSLAMSAIVLWAPVGFFVPQVASGLQSLMLPSLVFFGILFVALFSLEFKVLQVLAKGPVDTGKFNFGWLADVFAFGLVALNGSGIAITANDPVIARLAGMATLVTIAVGLVLLATKMFYLVRNQLRARRLPDTPILPAFFVLVPILCLFGISLFRMPPQLQTFFSFDVTSFSSQALGLTYAAAVAWVVFAIVLLTDYFKTHFIRSKYSPPQWGIV
ncbi:MAG: hypothetical protein P3T54_00860 [Dehalogenimonas sp.]|jgi:hypothetical protein|uniref:Uncharacterized protein n=2 Tax=Candidatus Dehalogenimonas loeffleri TaxID=3127115 RepID=A0ABZ2J2R7_9CHLR|nr:hypothetical protein [Dehalogenimonas sp.]